LLLLDRRSFGRYNGKQEDTQMLFEPMKPLVVDLCCGLGGWARGFLDAGWDVLGFDVEPVSYPGPLVLQDVRTLDGRRFRHAALIVASPPCQAFSRMDMPWTRAKQPAAPDLSIAEACFRIAREAAVPLVLENVRGAQPYLGRAEWRYGSQYLWGDGVPLLRPTGIARTRDKEWLSPSADRHRRRSMVPYSLARFIAENAQRR
jgi:hypothetical protein